MLTLYLIAQRLSRQYSADYGKGTTHHTAYMILEANTRRLPSSL